MLSRAAWLALGLAGLSACQPQRSPDEVARVNHESLTRQTLQVQQQLWPATPANQGLERAIERSLAAQRAVALGLHREPWVQERLEVVRAEVLRQALRETVEAELPTLAPGAVQAHYDAHPALYAERRLYNLRRVEVEVAPERAAAVQARALAAKHLPDFMAYLKTERLKVQAQQLVAAGPELPPTVLQALEGLAEGQMRVAPTAKGLELWLVVSARLQPISLARARPEIEALLVERWRRARWQQELASLRASARIERNPAWAPSPPASAPSNAASAGAAPSLLKSPLSSSQPAVLETH